MAENNRPVQQVRIGRIKAAVFENGDIKQNENAYGQLFIDGQLLSQAGSHKTNGSPLGDTEECETRQKVNAPTRKGQHPPAQKVNAKKRKS